MQTPFLGQLCWCGRSGRFSAVKPSSHVCEDRCGCQVCDIELTVTSVKSITSIKFITSVGFVRSVNQTMIRIHRGKEDKSAKWDCQVEKWGSLMKWKDNEQVMRSMEMDVVCYCGVHPVSKLHNSRQRTDACPGIYSVRSLFSVGLNALEGATFHSHPVLYRMPRCTYWYLLPLIHSLYRGYVKICSFLKSDSRNSFLTAKFVSSWTSWESNAKQSFHPNRSSIKSWCISLRILLSCLGHVFLNVCIAYFCTFAGKYVLSI